MSAAITEAVVEQYAAPGKQDGDVLSLIAARPALREAFFDTVADIEDPLAAVIAGRRGEQDQEAAQVLAACVAAAIRIALRRWIHPANGGLVVVSGSPRICWQPLSPPGPSPGRAAHPVLRAAARSPVRPSIRASAMGSM